MKRIEQYIPIAVNTVEDLFFEENGKVASEYDNIVSRFGVALRQLGLRTTILAFSSDSERSKVSRKKVIQAIRRIIEMHEKGVCDPKLSFADDLKTTSNEAMLKRKITDAAIALKLAFRLFIEEEIASAPKGGSDD